jgi:hypothetical protein
MTPFVATLVADIAAIILLSRAAQIALHGGSFRVVAVGFASPAALARDQVPKRLTDPSDGPGRSSWVAVASDS